MDEPLFEKALGFPSCLMPTDQPGNSLARVFIQEQIEV